MRITASAVSLNVDDVPASSNFLRKHFGFEEKMAADGFASLGRHDSAMNVIFLRRGLEMLPEGFRDQRSAGVIVAFVVDDLAREEARLREEGVAITMPLREEPWGERLFQVTDPNGVVIELVEWTTAGEAEPRVPARGVRDPGSARLRCVTAARPSWPRTLAR